MLRTNRSLVVQVPPTINPLRTTLTASPRTNTQRATDSTGPLSNVEYLIVLRLHRR